MRKKDDTMRGTLLDAAREIADMEGINAVNIRSIAQRAGAATGTVYNYFSNKDEILLALTEEYWEQTLEEMGEAVTQSSFCGRLQEIYTYLRVRIDQSAGKLMNSLGNVETAGTVRMASMQSALETVLIQCLEQDGQVHEEIWDETFTREQFAHFIMINMMMLLKMKAPVPDYLISIIKRIIY